MELLYVYLRIYAALLTVSVGLMAIHYLMNKILINRLLNLPFPRKVERLCSYIGIPFHELSHLMMCLLFRHKIHSVQLFHNFYSRAHVRHSWNRRSYLQEFGQFFISCAPLLILSVCYLFAFSAYFPNNISLKTIEHLMLLLITDKPLLVLLLVYLLPYYCAPSWADCRNVWESALSALFIFSIGMPFVPLQYIFCPLILFCIGYVSVWFIYLLLYIINSMTILIARNL